jgi:hypothetical protein
LREERRLRLFENRVLRRIFGPKRDEVTRERRKLNIEELNNLHFSPNIIRVTKSKRMKRARHVTHTSMERGEMYRGFWWGNLSNLENSGLVGKIILRWIFKKWNGGARAGLIWLRVGRGGGLL